MEEEEMKAILREAFGDSSSDSDGEPSSDLRRRVGISDSSDEIARPLSIFGDSHIWEQITEINGLWICRDFLSADQQSSLLSALEKEGYLAEASHNQVKNPHLHNSICSTVCSNDSSNVCPEVMLVQRASCGSLVLLYSTIWIIDSNSPLAIASQMVMRLLETNNATHERVPPQAMRFGDLPPWALELSHLIRENICFSSDFAVGSEKQCLFPSELLWREPLFNQLIVNMYQPGEGIGAHVDLMRFEDGIAIISLESRCVMHFSSGGRLKIPVLLRPGSLVLMWGEARYLWKHEINRHPGFQIWQGKQVHQKRRTSVTLRRLSQTEQ
ncbi:2-oxoglutarate and oxygenase superfamily protein [Perilla frutescens var. frutescens]|nr:2-oxoglutarate and oxygenase superfamily protein [Perilla frutescens var. frutescens]